MLKNEILHKIKKLDFLVSLVETKNGTTYLIRKGGDPVSLLELNIYEDFLDYNIHSLYLNNLEEYNLPVSKWENIIENFSKKVL